MKSIKNKVLTLMLILFTIFSLGFNNTENNVLVIPIEGEINRSTYNFVKDSMDKVDLEKIELIIFEIDTYGGLIDQAINIKDLIISSKIPTVSFVNNKAVSAGVLITIASDYIVMSSSATIGSAETIPESEKVLSMWRGVLRDTAQLKGRDAKLVEAMADKDINIDGVVSKGKLLNLTSSEAFELGFSDLTANSYEEIIEYLNIKDPSVSKVTESLQVKLTKYISSPFISSLLLSLGLVGMVVEILTPGFGIGGTISIVGFGLFFGGNILAGYSNWVSLMLFVIGIILITIAIIVPGFGVPEIGGLTFMVGGVILAVDSIGTAMFSLSVAIILTTIITMILIKFGFKSRVLNKIVLSSNHSSDKGYVSADSMDKYLNKKGIALTELRPTGFVEIEDERLDVLADGDFIIKGSKIKVVRVLGSTIFVRRI